MPELDFKGKEFVRNHHLTVPYRPLVPHPEKSIGDGDLDGNLIIHGDNLEALKALLPRYAGKVDCIFIDPPYNTGNEGWCYNDNVNSPMLKAWFSENPVGVDDGLRHDKWCCMMWPRLKLLWELLSETGSLWMTLDDIEEHRAVALMHEIADEYAFECCITWIKRYTRSNNAQRFSSSKDHLLVFGKGGFAPGKEARSEESEESYSNPDNDPNGPWITASYVNPATKSARPNLCYAIKNPHTGQLIEHPTHAWKYKKATHEKHVEENRLYWGEEGEYQYPRLKIYLKDGVVPIDVWSYQFAGTTDEATGEIVDVFGHKAFDTPKPTRLIERVLELGAPALPEAIVLDSFAGSGTTAHAVLNLNKKDGGNRKFILVEMEDYADSLTAERVRRVIKGYPYKGTQRETLFEKKLTWSELKKGDTLREEAENAKRLHEHDFDRISIKVDDGVLKVIGERDVEEAAPGLGGSFTYCTLGEPLKLDEMLKGKGLPKRDDLGAWLLYVAGTGAETEKAAKISKALQEHFLAKQGEHYYWLLYRPDKDWLRSGEAALTLDLARAIAKVDPKAEHRVFAPQKFVSNKVLRAEGLRIEFAAIPFALFRRGAE
jgi:adenine-specific DNA-methyltransferase